MNRLFYAHASSRRAGTGTSLPPCADRYGVERHDQSGEGLRSDAASRTGRGGLSRDGGAASDQDTAAPVIASRVKNSVYHFATRGPAPRDAPPRRFQFAIASSLSQYETVMPRPCEPRALDSEGSRVAAPRARSCGPTSRRILLRRRCAATEDDGVVRGLRRFRDHDSHSRRARSSSAANRASPRRLSSKYPTSGVSHRRSRVRAPSAPPI